MFKGLVAVATFGAILAIPIGRDRETYPTRDREIPQSVSQQEVSKPSPPVGGRRRE